MICKYCGEELPENAKKCSRCGEAFSAKSDCGGFYDLVHVTPKKAEPAPQAPSPVMMPSAPAPQEKGFFPLKYDLFAAIISGAVVLLLILNIILLAQLSGVKEQIRQNLDLINALSQDVDEVEDQVEDTEGTEGTEPEETDPTQPTENNQNSEEEKGDKGDKFFHGQTDLSERNTGVRAVLANNKADEVKITLEGYEEQTFSGQKLDGIFTYDEKNFLSHMAFDVETNTPEKTLDVQVSHAMEGEKLKITADLVTIDSKVFGEKGSVEFTWNKKTDAGEWIAADVDSENPAVLICEKDSVMELKLEIKYENTKGKCLTVIIEGMAVTQEFWASLNT